VARSSSTDSDWPLDPVMSVSKAQSTSTDTGFAEHLSGSGSAPAHSADYCGLSSVREEASYADVVAGKHITQALRVDTNVQQYPSATASAGARVRTHALT
jgi:hypothetical protein